MQRVFSPGIKSDHNHLTTVNPESIISFVSAADWRKNATDQPEYLPHKQVYASALQAFRATIQTLENTTTGPGLVTHLRSP
jgi:hypothetical protein